MLRWSFRDGRSITVCNNDAPRWGKIAYFNIEDAKDYEEFAVNLTTDGKLLDDDGNEVPPERLSEVASLIRDVNREKAVADYSEPSAFSELEKITDPDKQNDILSKLDFGSTPLETQVLRYQLDSAELKPHYSMRISDKTIVHFSDIFSMNKTRPAIIGFIERNSKVTPHSYYLSGSQGVWRYLPGWTDLKDTPKWFVKNGLEQCLNLPIPMQKALAEIASRTPTATTVDGQTYDDLFFDIAGEVKGDADGLLEFQGLNKLYPPDGIRKSIIGSKPESIDFTSADDPQHPNFSRHTDTWTIDTPTYGRIEVEIFPSNDHELNYMFCRDSKGRTWIAGIDVADSPIKTMGLRKTIFNSRLLTIPVFEYSSTFEAKKYEAPSITTYYSDMWPVFHSKLPVIQRYLDAKKSGE